MRILVTIVMCLLGMTAPAKADFIVSSAIVEFTADGPMQKDIELISRSDDTEYIDTQIDEIVNPGTATETRRTVTDPTKNRLLVTPAKTVLGGNGRRVLRFVLLQKPDEQEHIFRVALKPVIKGIDNDSQVGLKVLVGYEVLVIIRPASMRPSYTAQRNGNKMVVQNTGNTNILFQNGHQCAENEQCPLPPVLRAYAGTTAQIDLPSAAPVTYSVWDGAESIEKPID